MSGLVRPVLCLWLCQTDLACLLCNPVKILWVVSHSCVLCMLENNTYLCIVYVNRVFLYVPLHVCIQLAKSVYYVYDISERVCVGVCRLPGCPVHRWRPLGASAAAVPEAPVWSPLLSSPQEHGAGLLAVGGQLAQELLSGPGRAGAKAAAAESGPGPHSFHPVLAPARHNYRLRQAPVRQAPLPCAAQHSTSPLPQLPVSPRPGYPRQ